LVARQWPSQPLVLLCVFKKASFLARRALTHACTEQGHYSRGNDMQPRRRREPARCTRAPSLHLEKRRCTTTRTRPRSTARATFYMFSGTPRRHDDLLPVQAQLHARALPDLLDRPQSGAGGKQRAALWWGRAAGRRREVETHTHRRAVGGRSILMGNVVARPASARCLGPIPFRTICSWSLRKRIPFLSRLVPPKRSFRPRSCP